MEEYAKLIGLVCYNSITLYVLLILDTSKASFRSWNIVKGSM